MAMMPGMVWNDDTRITIGPDRIVPANQAYEFHHTQRISVSGRSYITPVQKTLGLRV